MPSIEEDAAAEDARIAREEPVPSAVAQDDHRLCRGRLVVGRRQRASHRGVDPEHLEEVTGDERAEYQAFVRAAGDLGTSA